MNDSFFGVGGFPALPVLEIGFFKGTVGYILKENCDIIFFS